MARERYLVNAGEETIHTGQIKPETPKDKRENWWYYHRGHLFWGVALAAIVCSIIYSIASKVEPDYTVALLTSYTMAENGRTELERCLEEYADDRNGDGKVEVTVVNYVFSSILPSSPEAATQMDAYLTKFIADCTTNESMIFLCDDEAFRHMQEDFKGFFLYNDGSAMPENARDYENARLPWSEFAALSSFVPETGPDDSFTGEILSQLYEKLKVSVRAAEGTSIERKEKDIAYHQASLAFYQRLKNGEKPQPAGEEQ